MPADVRPHPDTPLLAVVREALKQTHNLGRSVDEWTVTNALGRLLDTTRLVGEYGLEEGDTLFIQVAVGAGGDVRPRTLSDREPEEWPVVAEAMQVTRRLQLADPAVTRAKFDWDLAHYRSEEAAQRRQGVLLIRADFPQVLLAFAMPGRPMSPILFGALIDYTDYDHTAPSIELVDPLTEQPYKADQLPAALTRTVITLQDTGSHAVIVPLVNRARIPMGIRIPGSRDYYEHPAVGRHAWAAARVSDAGSLTALVDQLRVHLQEADDGREVSVRGSEVLHRPSV
jgi:hypothetical protein